MRDQAASVEEQRHGQNAEGCCKTAVDLARYRLLLGWLRPTLLIECGTWSGRSALWFADNGAGHVITIDVSHGARELGAEATAGDRITWLLGSSAEPAIVATVAKAAAAIQATGGHTLVVLDSNHSGPHVLAEMNAYGPMVTAGSYLVVEDGIMAAVPEQWPYYDGNPLDAIAAWAPAHRHDWECDTDLEDLYPTTQHPQGFWRRLR